MDMGEQTRAMASQLEQAKAAQGCAARRAQVAGEPNPVKPDSATPREGGCR